MWANVQRDLTEILSSRLFPTLASDPGYRVMLRNAGLTSIPDYQDGKVDSDFAQAQRNWGQSVAMKTPISIHSSTGKLPPAVHSKLETAARMCTQLLFMDSSTLGALRERRAKAVVAEGPITLYRMWDSQKGNRTGHWWFGEHLLNLAAAQSAAAGQSVRDWLRDRLAVSLDFSACDCISKLTLTGRAALPAIEAWGLPMPQYSPVTRNPKGDTVGTAGPDYWAKYGAMFQGEKTQYFLPFIPPDRIHDSTWS
jgi:hypothetical protein